MELAPVLCDHCDFDRLRWIYFCGQIGTETDGLSLSPMRENMNFRAEGNLLVDVVCVAVAIRTVRFSLRAKGVLVSLLLDGG